MHTYFISDLHLSDDRPDILRAFVRFLHQQAPSADALYILGDLFEIWVGDDDLTPTNRQVADELAALADLGVPSYFIHGNRDFLLGKAFARRARLILLDEECCINLYGRNTLLLHGDTLCSDDLSYQDFRRKVQRPWLQRLFLWLPLGIRQHLALKIRKQSNLGKMQKSMGLMDVNQEQVTLRFNQHKLDWMIHGHTHQPAVHAMATPNQQRIVLGDWYEQRSILTVTPDSYQLNGDTL
jgi:UDP-2,3-diacylglucosamine hydrolase